MKPNIIFLALAVDAALTASLETELASLASVQKDGYDMKYFESPLETAPLAILCGPSEEMSSMEVAQSLRMIYPDAPLFFMSVDRSSFDRKSLQKNGFTDAYLWPADKLLVIETLRRLIAAHSDIKVFRTVRILDIPAESTLGFDLYVHLPANNKYLKYAAASDVLNESRLQRLQDRQIQSAAVSEDQIKQFYQFVAAQLKNLNSSSAISETEKTERRQGAVRDLFSGIFGDSGKDDTLGKGRQVMADCQEIIKSYIMNECESPIRWMDKFFGVTASSGDTYNRAANISTYAALFSIGLGVGKADEVALAGLLHDIGLVDVPADILQKPESERTPSEQEIYARHPLLSVEMMKEKKLIVPEKVMKIVAQHHERFDGKGFPEGLPGPRILREAQLLAIADLFEELTRVTPGRVQLKPVEAIGEIVSRNSSSVGQTPFDPDLLQKISSLFQTNSAA